MKSKNKKTGEMGDLIIDKAFLVVRTGTAWMHYYSLAELNEEWEDYEEPKEDGLDNIIALVEAYSSHDSERYPKEIVEKLKAFKRLKDKGFRFKLTPATGSLDTIQDKFQIEINADMPAKWFCCDAVHEDLKACFGGEE